MSSLEYIRKYYGVPAQVGVRVTFSEPGTTMEGKRGVITGSSGPHVMVQFDCYTFSVPVHPTALRYETTEKAATPKESGQ